MKKLELCLFACLTVGFLAPSALYSQGPPPLPPCCPRSPGILPDETQPTLQSPTLIARFTVSRGMLESGRLTRREFIDRVLQNLLSGENIDILVFDKVTLDQPVPVADNANFIRARQAFLVQETRVFRMPLLDMTVEEFEKLDHIALTNGVVSIEIRFVAAGAIDSGPDGDDL
jgi:hypothetical protein